MTRDPVTVRLTANRKRSKAVVGLGQSTVARPFDLFDAVMRGAAELRRRCKVRSPYWLKVYVVSTTGRDRLLAAFSTDEPPETIDDRCGRLLGEARRLSGDPNYLRRTDPPHAPPEPPQDAGGQDAPAGGARGPLSP